MTHAGSQRPRYTDRNVADALDALVKDRGLESRYAAMRVVIVEGLEAAGYLKRIESDFLSTMSDDVTF